MADGRRVVLGVTGGVAAYKAAYLARRLIETGADVRVIMTDAAQQFIGKATFAALTGTPPVSDFFGEEDESPHTTLGRWADAIVIAPATASTVSRLANGESSNVLIATVLASTAPVVIAPAMHTEMWDHPATRRNIETLQGFGYVIVDPEIGALAGGDEGIGRLADPDSIADVVNGVLTIQDMAGLRVLITAGGTREPIDPVRYIGNRSSGKMGNALAETAIARGAQVVLVTSAPPPDTPGVDVVRVDTAEEMADAVWSRTDSIDVAVMAAAVADFKPETVDSSKIRRTDGVPMISLVPTPDVLAGVHNADPRPVLVGFAAETGSVDAAADKARSKGVDLLVANDVAKPGSGFGSDTNEIRLVFKDGSIEDLELMSKQDAASRIWDAVLKIRTAS